MGLTRGVVAATEDPTGEQRVQVTVLTVAQMAPDTVWARRVYPLAAFGHLDLEPGSEVWIAYEADDPDLPVVVGCVRPPQRGPSLARDREAMGDAWDRGHAAGAGDSVAGGETRNPYR